MSKKSAGILLYRWKDQTPEVFLVHPGGPYFIKKDMGSWSIPKGEFDEGEDPLEAAKREFFEETGFTINGTFIPFESVKQISGKLVFAWAVEGDIDALAIKSNSFTIEWPPRSGKMSVFPEVDRGEWFTLETAKQKIIPAQAGFLDQLSVKLKSY